MNQLKKEKVINFLNESGLDIDFNYHLKDNDFETFEDIREILEDNNALEVEIIYYSNAIKYLMENDNSLKESLELASDMGFETSSLNSEILASLLATENLRNDFYDLKGEINEIL